MANWRLVAFSVAPVLLLKKHAKVVLPLIWTKNVPAGKAVEFDAAVSK